MTSQINRSQQVVSDTRMSLEELQALDKQGAADVAAKSAAEAKTQEDFNRRKRYADQLGRINRQGSLGEKRTAALSAAYAALEAGVPEAFVRQGLRSLNLRESKEDRIKRRQAEEKAEEELRESRRERAEADKKRREEARAASKARVEERRKAREAERAAKEPKESREPETKEPEKGIPPKAKTDPLNLGVDADADPKTTPPVTQEEGYDAKGNPLPIRSYPSAKDDDDQYVTLQDRFEAAGVSGSKNPFPEMGKRGPTRREMMESMTVDEIVANFPDMDKTRARMFKINQAEYDPVGAGVDMTPIDVEAENRMLMEDILNFGPVPKSVTPQGGTLTPSQIQDMNLKDRPGSKAPGAVGSAPNMIDSLGFTAPSGNGFGDPAAAAAAQENRGLQRGPGPETVGSAQPAKQPAGLIDRARQGVQGIQEKFRSGQAAQREMMAPITDQVGTFDIDETLENLQTEFDDLSKQKKVRDLKGKVQGLQKDLAKGQKRSGIPHYGFGQAFDENIRQPLRDLLGMN